MGQHSYQCEVFVSPTGPAASLGLDGHLHLSIDERGLVFSGTARQVMVALDDIDT